MSEHSNRKIADNKFAAVAELEAEHISSSVEVVPSDDVLPSSDIHREMTSPDTEEAMPLGTELVLTNIRTLASGAAQTAPLDWERSHLKPRKWIPDPEENICVELATDAEICRLAPCADEKDSALAQDRLILTDAVQHETSASEEQAEFSGAEEFGLMNAGSTLESNALMIENAHQKAIKVDNTCHPQEEKCYREAEENVQCAFFDGALGLNQNSATCRLTPKTEIVLSAIESKLTDVDISLFAVEDGSTLATFMPHETTRAKDAPMKTTDYPTISLANEESREFDLKSDFTGKIIKWYETTTSKNEAAAWREEEAMLAASVTTQSKTKQQTKMTVVRDTKLNMSAESDQGFARLKEEMALQVSELVETHDTHEIGMQFGCSEQHLKLPSPIAMVRAIALRIVLVSANVIRESRDWIEIGFRVVPAVGTKV